MFYSCLVGKSLYWVLWQTGGIEDSVPIRNLRKISVCVMASLGVYQNSPQNEDGLVSCRVRGLPVKPPLLSKSKWANREEIIFRLTSNCLTKIYPTGLK